MQLRMPLYTSDVTLITNSLGFQKRGDLIYYYLSGLPIHTHLESDYRSFRYITSNFVLQGLCSRKEISIAFDVSYESVKKNVQKLAQKGVEGFFLTTVRTHGGNVKIQGDLQNTIQAKLDKQQSVLSIAKEVKLSEGAIRAAIKRGTLKKR